MNSALPRAAIDAEQPFEAAIVLRPTRLKMRLRWCYRTETWRRNQWYRLHKCAECKTEFVGSNQAQLCWSCNREVCRLRVAMTALATRAVAKEIRLGNLEHPSQLKCIDCGVQAEQYDHRDYTKHLEIQPVCTRCNIRRGPGAPNLHLRRRRPSHAGSAA